MSGVFRLYRGDWESVESYMSKVAGNMWSSTAIKVDANLLRAFASERRNVSGRGSGPLCQKTLVSSLSGW